MSSEITFEKSTNSRSRAIQNNNMGSVVDNSNNVSTISNIDVDNDIENSMLLEENIEMIDDSSSRLNIHNCYPLTWLPLLQSNSEAISIEHMNTSCNFPPGTIVQLPVSYSRDSCNASSISVASSNNMMNGMKILGLVVGPNTMVPLQSLSLLGLDAYTKVEDSSLSINSNNLIDGENIIKLGIQNESIVNNSSVPDNEIMSQIRSECHRSVLNSEIDGNSSHLNCSPQTDDTFSNQIISQTPVQWYVCEVCGKSFKDLMEIIKHTSSVHAVTFKGPKCPHCEFVTKIDFGYILNDTSYHQLHNDRFSICQNCDKEFFYNIPSLFQTDSSYANIRFACKICGRTYKHNRDLKKHERSRHPDNLSNPNNDSFVINEPNLTDRYQNKSNIYKEAQPTVRLRCSLCEKFFRGPYELRRHVRSVHENRRPYSCQQCDKSFRDTYELKRHSSSHQRMASINTSHEGGTMELSLVSQNVASFLSNSHRHLTDNSNSHVEYDSRTSNNSLALVVNEQSLQISTNNTSNSMMLIDNFYCQVCDKNFRGANEFKRHLAVVHEKKYRYRCLHCSKFWRDQYDLKRHCRRSHCQDKEIDKDYLRQCLLDKSSSNQELGRNEQNISLMVHSQEDSRFHLNTYHSSTGSALNSNNSAITISSSNYHNDDVLSNGINYSMDSNIMLCDSGVSQSTRNVNGMISQRPQHENISHDSTAQPVSNDIVNHQSSNSNKITQCQSNNYLNQLPSQSSQYSNQVQMRNAFFNVNLNVSCNKLQVNFTNGDSIPCTFNSSVHSTINSDSIDSIIIPSSTNTFSGSMSNNKTSNQSFLGENENTKSYELSTESNFILAKPVNSIQLNSDSNSAGSIFNNNNTEGDDNDWSFNRNSIRDRDVFINSSPIKSVVQSSSSNRTHSNT